MAVRVPFTSGIDKFLLVFKILTSIFWIVLFVGGVIDLSERTDFFDNISNNTTINTIVFFVLIIAGFAIARFIHKKTTGRLLNTLSAYLYVRAVLKTKITWENAGLVSFLFTSNETGKWWPLKEVRNMPENEREKYILDFADQLLIKKPKG